MNKKEKRKHMRLEARNHCPHYSNSRTLDKRIYRAKTSKCKGKAIRVIADKLKFVHDKYPELNIMDSALIHAEPAK